MVKIKDDFVVDLAEKNGGWIEVRHLHEAIKEFPEFKEIAERDRGVVYTQQRLHEIAYRKLRRMEEKGILDRQYRGNWIWGARWKLPRRKKRCEVGA